MKTTIFDLNTCMHKKNQGSYGEHVVITECLRRGLSVFKDVGDNSRFDLIVVDYEGNLHKVQVKCYTADKNDRVVLNFWKAGPNYRFKYEQTDVDWFAVVENKTGRLAWVRYSDFSNRKKQMTINFEEFERFPWEEI